MRLFEFAFLFAMLFSPVGFAGTGATLFLDQKIEVTERKSSVWFDYVRLQGASPDLIRLLQQTPWQSDDLGGLTQQLKEIRKENEVAHVRIILPQTLTVDRIKKFSRAEFQRKIENFLSSQCESCTFDWLPVASQKNEPDSDWRLDESSLRLQGNNLVSVFSSRGTSWIPVKIKIQKPIYVSAKNLEAGTVIDGSNVELKRMDISSGAIVPIESDSWGQLQLTHHVQAGQIIQRSDLRAVEFVKRGQIVKVVSGTDDFQIVTQATAQGAGSLNENVAVKMIPSGKQITAKVIESGIVRVE